MRLFVYGTLKRGGRLHNYLCNQTFICEAQTVPRYMLYGVPGPDTCNFPMIYEIGDKGTSVKGEVWEIDSGCLRLLDRLEHYPEVYDRREIELVGTDPAICYIPKKHPFHYGFPELGDNWPVRTPVAT